MVLGKLPVLGRPPNLDYSRARAYCACNRCWWGMFGHFFSRLSFLFSFSLSLGDGPIQSEILSQRAIKPKNNQPTNYQCIKFHLIPFSTFRDMLRTSFLLQKLKILLKTLYQCMKCHSIPLFTFKDMFQSSFLLQKIKKEVTL